MGFEINTGLVLLVEYDFTKKYNSKTFFYFGISLLFTI